MDYDALIWLALPLIFMVIYVVLMRTRPNALKPSRKGYAVAIIVIVLVIIYAVWNLFFRQ